jgi:hypothetical protein
MTEKYASLFKETYGSMLDRTKDNGYAQTSINGVYPGMFCRDASIQMMMHVEAGDYNQALRVLQYTVDYHKKHGFSYVLHVMNNKDNPITDKDFPISDKIQADTTFFFLHAWYLYATRATDSPQKTAFLESSRQQIFTFADYYLDKGHLHENGLLHNPSLEHSREVRYWYGYDLLTNVYASQAWHEMALYFADSYPEKAKRWGDAAERIVQGVHEHLTYEIDGKRFYAELIDLENDSHFVPGFSWVNLAPMGCDWYGADKELLENTYQLYMQYGSCEYYNKYQMLEVVSTYGDGVKGDHVIGKGLAWEMIYCKKMGYTHRLQTLSEFVELYSDKMYRETWGYDGGGSDTANQEHASWSLYAHMLCYPELKELVEPIPFS